MYSILNHKRNSKKVRKYICFVVYLFIILLKKKKNPKETIKNKRKQTNKQNKMQNKKQTKSIKERKKRGGGERKIYLTLIYSLITKSVDLIQATKDQDTAGRELLAI